MTLGPIEGGRPLRAVVFAGGPTLMPEVQEFIRRLEQHPEIEFAGGFCESSGQDLRSIAFDLWRRRRFLALPLLFQRGCVAAVRFLAAPREQIARRRVISSVAGRIHFVPDIHAEAVHDEVRSLQPDLGLIYGSPILKPSLFQIPAVGTLGIHHGKVPEYRGKKTMFWAMYNGEPSAGVTIQHVGAGLDTGDVVASGEVAIGRRPPWVVWRELEQRGFELYLKAILAIKHGNASRRPQAGKKRKLYKDPKLGDVVVFWLRYVARLFRQR